MTAIDVNPSDDLDRTPLTSMMPMSKDDEQTTVKLPTMTLLTLPPEVLTNIVSRLDVRSRCRSAAVCGLLRGIVSQPTVWRDVTRVYVLEQSVNEYSCASLAKVEQAVTTLLTYSRPKDLVVRQDWYNGSVYGDAFRLMLARLSPLLPDSIERLMLAVVWYNEHTHKLCADTICQLVQLLPNLRLVSIVAGKTEEETERAVNEVCQAFFTQHANASKQTTLEVDVQFHEYQLLMRHCLEDSRQTHGCVTVDIKYQPVEDYENCLDRVLLSCNI